MAYRKLGCVVSCSVPGQSAGSDKDAQLAPFVAAALTEPARASERHAMLLARFDPISPIGFKHLLAAAPLDGIELERLRDTGRTMDF